MALAGMAVKLSPRWQPFERVTADSWLRRWMGAQAYETFFKPLLIGKFADDYDRVPMSFMWARIVKRTLKLGTFQGGFQAFLDELARQLEAQGAQIRLNAPARRITVDDGGLCLAVTGETHRVDRLLCTTSPSLLLRLAAGLEENGLRRKGSGAEEHRRFVRCAGFEAAAAYGWHILAESARQHARQIAI